MIFKWCFSIPKHKFSPSRKQTTPTFEKKRWTWWAQIFKSEVVRERGKGEMLRWKMVEICYRTRNRGVWGTSPSCWGFHCWFLSEKWGGREEKRFFKKTPQPTLSRSLMPFANPLPRLYSLYNPQFFLFFALYRRNNINWILFYRIMETQKLIEREAQGLHFVFSLNTDQKCKILSRNKCESLQQRSEVLEASN